MGNVVRLAVANSRPARNACTDCKHYHPDTAAFGVEGWKWLWFGPGFRPTSNAMRFGICSALGGEYASLTRRNSCKGQLWESFTPQPNVDEGDGK